MNTYKLTFVNDGPNPAMLEFVEDDINTFDILFQSNYSEALRPYSANISPKDVKVQILISFICKNENFNRIGEFFADINQNSEITEVIVYKNDDLICDLTNIIDLSSASSLMDSGVLDSGFTLSIIEGV